jgi:hypothetical protein
MSWGKQGQLLPCCDLPELLSVISWQPSHRTQAKDGATLDGIKEKDSVHYQERFEGRTRTDGNSAPHTGLFDHATNIVSLYCHYNPMVEGSD